MQIFIYYELKSTCFSSWIGLQKSSSAHLWNYGSSCPPVSAVYQGWDTSSDTGTNLGYTMAGTSLWKSASANALATSAICRMGRFSIFRLCFDVIY